MDKAKVISELSRKYPGKNIVMNDPINPTEIICEIEPASENPDQGTAIAVIDTVVHHYHKNTTEVYEVIRGDLIVTSAGKQTTITPGQKITIHPNEVHTAEGHGTWVKVTSRPAWTPDDHYVVATATEDK